MTSTTRAATLAAFVALSATAAFALPNAPDIIPTKGAPIRITPIYHASLQIEWAGRIIQVDPFSAGDFTGVKKADLILITHTHPDHLDLKAIRGVSGANTAIIAPPIAKANLQALGNQIVSFESNGEGISFGRGHGSGWVTIEAVPAYNIKRGPKPGQKFHPKGQFNGYILTLGGKRIYIAGDTEATPEMKALKNIDVAFIPMNLPYTMTPQEAAEGVRAFKPKIVYPYHYRFPFDKPNGNPQQFKAALAGSGIEVRIRGWYAHPAGK